MQRRAGSTLAAWACALALAGGATAAAAAAPVKSDTTPPTAPADLLASAGESSVTLSWGASYDRQLSGYRVYRRNSDGTWPAGPLATVSKSTRSYADTGLVNGTAYTYRATAYDRAGNESAPSNEASATPLAPSPPLIPPSGIAWIGDYQTGDFSQWDRLQAVAGGATIVTFPVRRGIYSARYVVRPGDTPVGDRERAEAVASQSQTGGYEGVEAWYGWSTYFPSDFNPTPGTGVNYFTQWHETLNDGCTPNVAFAVNTAETPWRIRFRARGGRLETGCSPQYDKLWYPAELTLERWYDFVVHVRWSSDPAVGFVEVWIDGANVIPKTYIATLYTGQGVYLKQGFYRLASSLTSTVYHEGTKRGDSYAVVAP